MAQYIPVPQKQVLNCQPKDRRNLGKNWKEGTDKFMRETWLLRSSEDYLWKPRKLESDNQKILACYPIYDDDKIINLLLHYIVYLYIK